MSKIAHDQYIDADEEEETCPLCIEDFDLTDKGFKPCPCGYQICQFCYNSIKNNMNGLCPACRRPYDDKQIEYKQITPEETAAYKARQAQKQKKTQAALQKEKQKAEADSLSRKHLAGLRVVQKNLVYVTGIAPKMQEDELLQTLRGEKYFGRYGKIIKIVVSKARDKHDSVGVYVTYESKEDAASCIAAVDGFVSDDRTLRAQFGTTKYCSAYLRGDTCLNRNCMFLHEPGEAKDSYSRADLSALNAGSSQQGDAKPPPPQSQQPVSAAQPMTRQSSDPPSSPSMSDRPALPSTASWASKPQSVRTESRAAAISTPAQSVTVPRPEPQQPERAATRPIRRVVLRVSPLNQLLKNFNAEHLSLSFALSSISEQEREIIDNYPALFDLSGGLRRALRKQRDEEIHRLELETQSFRATPDAELNDDAPEMSGSMQLGGEPEDRNGLHALDGQLDQNFGFGASTERGMTPQQHQQILLQNLRTGNAGTQPPGHQRNVSRFSFANDTASASTAVKPVANAKLLNQQSSMMPAAGTFTGQQSSFFTSNVQGPPPGLKTTGTPPVSGGMTFGQGHGFTSGNLPYGSVAGASSRNANDEMMRDLMRGRTGADGNTKLTDDQFPPLSGSRQASISSMPPGLQDTTRRSTPVLPPGLEETIQSRRGTPTRLPGLGDDKPFGLSSKPTGLPDLEGTSRPSSRASLRRVMSSQIVPALPLRIGTPVKALSRPGTPSRLTSRPVSPVTKASREEASDKAQADTKVSIDGVEATSRAGTTDDANSNGIANDVSDVKVALADTQHSIPQDESSNENTLVDVGRRRHPGKLDISAAVQQQEAATEAALTERHTLSMAQHIAAQATSTASVPSSPSATFASPAGKTAPRTLRLVQTPKTESPPIVMPAIPAAVRKLPSRQPSVASMNLPGTPTSEQVSNSDNISITSTSRANSPPPLVSKVGTAPVRTKTKSQLKKERQERAKNLEELKIEGTSTAADEPMQEAIVGRKKKAKKEKEVKPKTKTVKDDEIVETTPTVSRPASPIEAAPVEMSPPPPPAIKAGAEMSPPATPTLSPAQLISELRTLEPNLAKSFDALFRMPFVGNTKTAQSIPAKDVESHSSWRSTEFGIKLGKEDINKLLAGYAATLGLGGPGDSVWSRAMITPGGAQLRALSEDLEQRFLELEKRIMTQPEELRFRPTKPQNETRFPVMDLKALKKAFDSKGPRGVSVMEQMVQDGSAMKKGAFLVDEVSKYINEFVMPPATPPPSAGRGAASGSQGQVDQATAREPAAAPLEIAERQLHEAKRAVDEREGALRRVIRKNKKLLGIN